MIGYKVKVVNGKNKGVVGFIKTDNKSRGQYVIDCGNGRLVYSKYENCQVFNIHYSDRSKELERAEEVYEGKYVTFNTRTAIKTDYKLYGSCMCSLVTLVYEDKGRIVANVVFKGHYAVVDVNDLDKSDSKPAFF